MGDPSPFFDSSLQAPMEFGGSADYTQGSKDDALLEQSTKGAAVEPSSATTNAHKASTSEISGSVTTKSSTDMANFDDHSLIRDDTKRDSTMPQDHQGSNTTTTAAPKDGDGATSEFDVISREAVVLLDKKLDNNRTWAKKLLREMSVYAKTLEEVHAEYSKIQALEHQESERLDQVEPDVQGATNHLLKHPLFAGQLGGLSAAFGNTVKTVSGAKRKQDQA